MQRLRFQLAWNSCPFNFSSGGFQVHRGKWVHRVFDSILEGNRYTCIHNVFGLIERLRAKNRFRFLCARYRLFTFWRKQATGTSISFDYNIYSKVYLQWVTRWLVHRVLSASLIPRQVLSIALFMARCWLRTAVALLRRSPAHVLGVLEVWPLSFFFVGLTLLVASLKLFGHDVVSVCFQFCVHNVIHRARNDRIQNFLVVFRVSDW